MKFLAGILLLLLPVFVSGQTPDIQNMSVLASQYYQNKEFRKAAELYGKLYEQIKAESYFNIYLECLINIPDFDQAEKAIRRGMRGNTENGYWYVQLGYLKKALGEPAEAIKLYETALSKLSNNPVDCSNLANHFLSRREFDYAEKVYLKGRALVPGNRFNYELARIYYYLRNYDRMMEEYLEWMNDKNNNVEIVKSNLISVLSTDNDQEISKQLKTYLLKRIQAEPNQLSYTRLLIWLFVQDRNFAAANRQAIALDKRTNSEDANILSLANASASGKEYSEAMKAYDYLISKGKQSEFYTLAVMQRMQMAYHRFEDENSFDTGKASELKTQFEQTFATLGYLPETSGLIASYAHLLAFYLNQPADALNVLNNGIAMRGLNLPQLSQLKTELSDINVYSGDLWEAVINYSQVIESNKNTPLGDDVKFKKARLGYYMGNFQWAKAQLDALRASTSKLIANDAMDLSLFINENLESDSTSAPLRIFARADLHLFRNHFSDALQALDSIVKFHPYNSLTDDVNYRKASIFEKQGKFAEAAAMLESIVKENSWEMLADDAVFQLAGIYQNKLNRKEEAMELYKKLMTNYPGSVYVVDSRAEYRKLQGQPAAETEKSEPVEPAVAPAASQKKKR